MAAKPKVETGNRAFAGFSWQTPVETGGRAIRPQPEVDPPETFTVQRQVNLCYHINSIVH